MHDFLAEPWHSRQKGLGRVSEFFLQDAACSPSKHTSVRSARRLSRSEEKSPAFATHGEGEGCSGWRHFLSEQLISRAKRLHERRGIFFRSAQFSWKKADATQGVPCGGCLFASKGFNPRRGAMNRAPTKALWRPGFLFREPFASRAKRLHESTLFLFRDDVFSWKKG